MIDDQFSFTFSKGFISLLLIYSSATISLITSSLIVSTIKFLNPNLIRKTRKIIQNNTKTLQNSISLSATSTSTSTTTNGNQQCKFPKWLNKRWNSIKQNKILALDHKLNTLIVYDEKKSKILEKHECIQVKSRKQSNYQVIIKSLNEW